MDFIFFLNFEKESNKSKKISINTFLKNYVVVKIWTKVSKTIIVIGNYNVWYYQQDNYLIIIQYFDKKIAFILAAEIWITLCTLWDWFILNYFEKENWFIIGV